MGVRAATAARSCRIQSTACLLMSRWVEFDQEFAAFRLIGQRAGDIEQGENVRPETDVAAIEIERLVFGRAQRLVEIAQLLEGVGHGEIVEKGIDLLADVGAGEKLRKNRLDRGFIAFDDQGVER